MTKKNTPTIITKIITFCKSFWNHIITGMKKSSIKEIEYRYSVCEGCEFFNFKNNTEEITATCDICGCSLSKKRILMNKLAWKDQKCPEGKW